MIGIDEAGRGCWAGPLVACALKLTGEVAGLNDSKKLTASKRKKLAVEIKAKAEYGVGWVPANEVDELGLTEANKLAMRRAADQLDLDTEIIIDGSINYLKDVEGAKAVVKADSKYEAVMAASIIAKVSRDEYMEKLAAKHPGFGFEKHKGYGTKLHADMLQEYGLTDEHRRSFKPIANYLR